MAWRRKPGSEPLDAEGARNKAMRLLGRREHSSKQLVGKLAEAGVAREDALPLVESLAADGWQSDARFAVALARSRLAQGFGPLRIRGDLGAAGLPRDEIQGVLDELAVDWDAECAATRARRCRGLPTTRDERNKQWRMLAQRGYESGQIKAALQACAEGAGDDEPADDEPE